MEFRAKLTILLIFECLVFMITACTPTLCTPSFNVTKSEDTNGGDCTAGDCSLREAVNKANSCPGSQTINLPAGEYILSLDGDDEDLGATGDLDITDDLIIIGTGAPSINGTIERAFHVHSGVSAEFNGIWLTGGDAIIGGGLINAGDLILNSFTCNYNNVSMPPGGMGDARGGCIFNGGNLVINNGHFLENSARQGGAVYNHAGSALEITNSSFTSNLAESLGGAIWNGIGSDLTISDSALDQNVAGLNGGAIWSHGNLMGDSLILENNEAAGSGGGIYSWESSAIFYDVWVTENTASLGGGIYNDHSMVHFYESGLTANHAFGNGGAVNNYDSDPAYPTGGLLMSNVTISGNTAGAGAGIYNSGNFDLRFITVANNDPEGIRIDAGNEIKLRSSILSNNIGGDCAGITPDSLDYNLTSDSSCALLGSHDILNVTTLIEPLGFHGATAPSHPLTYGSPAVDSGVPDLCISHDQNYAPRPQGAWCDRGAFENFYDKGILRGWTYIDANRNDQRDSTDGTVSGVVMELKDGPCPGGNIAATAVSNPDGLYRIYEIEPGDYCIDTSPLQQTMYPDYIDVSFAPGDILEDVNFRYLLSPLGNSSISGRIWHDECAVPYGPTSTLPPGCINKPGGGFAADGIYDPAEPGIEDLKVQVFAGSCPGQHPSISAEVFSEVSGEYSIPALNAGTWCIVVNIHETPNDNLLLPGSWSYPVRNADPAEFEVVLGESEHIMDIHFGWDYQFLPEPLIPYSYLCTAKSRAHIRRGPGTDFISTGLLEPEEPFEVKARSEQDEPLWLFGKSKSGVFGWVSESVLDCKELDPTKLVVEVTPLRLPTPTPTPIPRSTKPLVCERTLNQPQCLKAGGHWLKESCICPTPTPSR